MEMITLEFNVNAKRYENRINAFIIKEKKPYEYIFDVLKQD